MSAAIRDEPGFRMNEMQKTALERLLLTARGHSGQSERIADFLLAWWNGAECGRFDLTSMWGLDPHIAADMVTVFGLISQICCYPDQVGYEAQFRAILKQWRPLLVG